MTTKILVILTFISGIAFADGTPGSLPDCKPCSAPNVSKLHKKKRAVTTVAQACPPVCSPSTVVIMGFPAPELKVVVVRTGPSCDCGKFNHCSMSSCGSKCQCSKETDAKLGWKPVIGIHGALGLGLHDPYASGFLGLRVRVPKLYLGAELLTAFPYGIGLQFLIYAYQGRLVNVSVLNPGVWFNFSDSYLLASRDFHRTADLMLGAGVEFHVHKYVDVTVDYKANIADPAKAFNTKGVNGSSVWKNGFADSQVLIGCLVHF